MTDYVMEFRVVGEVADMLLMDNGARLLVDVSPDAPGHETGSIRKYPTRTTLTVIRVDLIEELLGILEVGQVVEASGTFCQSDYKPHKTTCIDTTFQVEALQAFGNRKHHARQARPRARLVDAVSVH